MAIALDMAAALMANGNSGFDMDEQGRGSCVGCCQIFIAYDPYLVGTREEIQDMLNKRGAAADSSHPEHEGGQVTCPGERTLAARERSMREGVTVDETIWRQVKAIAGGDLDAKDISGR